MRKRPCRICRRWYIPHPRVKDRQMTCGDPGCKREWHRKKCADWNRKNAEYFRANYLQKKLDAHPEPISFRTTPRESSRGNRDRTPCHHIVFGSTPLEAFSIADNGFKRLRALKHLGYERVTARVLDLSVHGLKAAIPLKAHMNVMLNMVHPAYRYGAAYRGCNDKT